MRVIDYLTSEITTEQQVTPPSHDHSVDWSAQNIVDTNQQIEIDALKAEIAALKSATPTTTTSTPIIKNTNTYGRRFIS